MAVSKDVRDKIIEEVVSLASKAQPLVMAEYRGITVGQMDLLRKLALSEGVSLHVLSASARRMHMTQEQIDAVAKLSSGPLIFGFSEDAVSAAKLLVKFSETHQSLNIIGGIIGSKSINPEEVAGIAKLSPEHRSLEDLAKALNTPIAQLAHALDKSAIPRQTGLSSEIDLELDAKISNQQVAQQSQSKKMEIFLSDEMIDLNEAASILRTDKSSIPALIKSGRIFSIDQSNFSQEQRFPRWQFHPRVFPWIHLIIIKFKEYDGWSIRYFFRHPSLFLNEKSPLELLKINPRAKTVQAIENFSAASAQHPPGNIAKILRAADYAISGQE